MADSLSTALAALQRRFGPHAVHRGERQERAGAWPAGLPLLDGVLTPGGLPRGRVTVLAAGSPRGPSGRLTLVQWLTAQATHDQDTAYVDVAGTLDPGFLADLGADLDVCLVVTPGERRWERGFAMARTLVRAGLPWVALALGGGASPPTVRWDRSLAALAEAVSARGAVAVIAAPAPLPAPIAHVSSLTLSCASPSWHRAHGDVAGLRVRLTVTKNKLGAPGAEATLLLRYPRPYVTAEVLGLPSVVPHAAESHPGVALQAAGAQA